MRITLDIDSELIKKVMKATGASTKKKAIEIAIKEYLHARSLEELSDLIGNYEEFGVTKKDLEKMCQDS